MEKYIDIPSTLYEILENKYNDVILDITKSIADGLPDSDKLNEEEFSELLDDLYDDFIDTSIQDIMEKMLNFYVLRELEDDDLKNLFENVVDEEIESAQEFFSHEHQEELFDTLSHHFEIDDDDDDENDEKVIDFWNL
ncbi:MAG: hypothetical protein ACK5LT_04905 [Lachnospirales bacterium]